jgi:hypothetical protein
MHLVVHNHALLSCSTLFALEYVIVVFSSVAPRMFYENTLVLFPASPRERQDRGTVSSQKITFALMRLASRNLPHKTLGANRMAAYLIQI